MNDQELNAYNKLLDFHRKHNRGISLAIIDRLQARAKLRLFNFENYDKAVDQLYNDYSNLLSMVVDPEDISVINYNIIYLDGENGDIELIFLSKKDAETVRMLLRDLLLNDEENYSTID